MIVRRCRRAITLLALGTILGSCWIRRSNEEVIRSCGNGDLRIKEACAVTVRTCTRCHDLNRIMVTRFDSPHGWPLLVTRMRFMQSSGISVADAQQVVTCLVYREFGRRGLDDLAFEGVLK